MSYGTTVDVKRANFKIFADLIGNQFEHGGTKYLLPGFSDREATDVISSVFGGSTEFDWILGTMMKYIFRFKNFQREKDLLKIATYCYILWLKQGNHLQETHDEDVGKDKLNANAERSVDIVSRPLPGVPVSNHIHTVSAGCDADCPLGETA